ncbi:hypothetical protein QUA54_33220 [Microcoleus sp. MOSTC5]
MSPGACILDAFGQRGAAVIKRFVVDRSILEISISIARNSQQMQK